MQKLGISLLFFTLCFTSASFAQGGAKNYSTFPNIDSILRLVNIDSIVDHLNVDSLLTRSRYQLSEADSALRHINVDSIVHSLNIDSIMHRINIDSIMRRLNIDSLWKAHKPGVDSLMPPGFGSLSPRFGSLENSASAEINPHYFSKNGERYYINILPPAQKGVRVDSSYVWLLGTK